MVSMHQPLSCLPKKMYMATTRIGGCVETTAPAEFQCVMDKILARLDFVRCYIDDIMVYNDTVEEH
jgi:hypothetical protein